MKELFHVHTYRCGHAQDIEDEAYIKKAVEMGADRITFTDHAPFTGDPFTGRMKMEQLQEYIATLSNLIVEYHDRIAVRIGLEAEYLPSYESDLAFFTALNQIDVLLLGQHHFEVTEGVWSFQRAIPDEWRGLAEAMIQGIGTGYFDVVAHPDRIFRTAPVWTEEMSEVSKRIIDAAEQGGSIPLERNLASMRQVNAYRPEFWELVPKEYPVIIGCDAHRIEDLAFS